MTLPEHPKSLPDLLLVAKEIPSNKPEPPPDVFLTYFAAQVHLAFNNELRPSPQRIIEVSRRLGITRQQCLLLLGSGKYVSSFVAIPSLATDDEYRAFPLANPDDYCVVAVSNVIEKIKEFPDSRQEVFDKLPSLLMAFDQTLTSEPVHAQPFWNYKNIALFLRSFFVKDHTTTSSGGLVGVAAKGHRRAGCSGQTSKVSPRKPFPPPSSPSHST